MHLHYKFIAFGLFMRLLSKISSFYSIFTNAPLATSVALSLFFLVGFADGVLMPFFAMWAEKDAGVTAEYIGLLLACYSAGELLATPFVGGIADRLGRRPVLLISTLGVGLGFALLYFVHGVFASAIVLISIGVFESVLHPTISAVIADSIPADQNRYYFSVARVMSNAGHVAGPAVGSLLALYSLGAVFLGSAVATLLGALIIFFCLPETLIKKDINGDEEEDESLSGILPAFRDARLSGLLMWSMCLQISSGWLTSVLPLYAVDAGTLTPSQVGLLFTYAATLTVLFQLWVSRVLASVANLWMVIGSGAVLIAAFAALLFSSGIVGLVLGVSLLSLSQMLFGPLLPTLIMSLAPSHARATYLAAASVTADLKDTLGPAAGTFLYGISARLPWFVGMPVALCATLALAFTIRRHERRAASAISSALPE
ncbi:MFS transporter [Undibacterium sp. TJN19]|uniref:MFS transporter n=1 Tax=Undibacterium sp. TJN19 TaxID=3413055 RepID=UPI003BF375B0